MKDGSDGTELVSFEAELDLRLLFFRSAFLMRFTVVLEPEVASLSLSLDVSELGDECSISARTPGWDSSSIMC